MSAAPSPTDRVKSLALALGFDLVGVAEAAPSRNTRFVREWVERGYAGCMHYITRRVEEREDPRRVLPGARSVVSVGLVYAPQGASDPRDAGEDRSGVAGRVARYARGDDYHEVLGDRLGALAAGIEALAAGPVRSRWYVDTGPVQERDFAARAGLGWIGKNACLIHPRLGSYLFLGVLLTDLELAPDAPEPDHCGSCRACLDACPTEAFPAPYVVDARRCIAYTTIEDPGPIPKALRSAHGDRLFGCDICQEVCPWNAPSAGRPEQPLADPLGLRERLAPRDDWLRTSLEWVLGLDEEHWRAATRNSALRRARRRSLVRNALVVAGNSGDRTLLPAIERHARGDDALLAEHARWALETLTGA